jgi:hypothetical protein
MIYSINQAKTGRPVRRQAAASNSGVFEAGTPIPQKVSTNRAQSAAPHQAVLILRDF